MSVSSSLLYSAAQPTSFTPWNISLSFITIWIIRLFYRVNRSAARKRDYSRFSDSNRCAPTTAMPKIFLGSIRHKVNLLLYPGGDLLDNVYATKFKKYGSTHALYDRYGVPVVIHTTDPVNLNAVLSKSSAHWGPSKSRACTMYPLAQDGLLNSEGEAWHRNRKLILRHLHNKHIKDVKNAEGDIELLFDAIGPFKQDGWTGVVDLLDLFHRMSLDISTSFLLGTSANSQVNGMRNVTIQAAIDEFGLRRGRMDSKMSYDEAYEIVRHYYSMRSKLGSKYWMADSLTYRQACDTLNSFADDLIKQAIARSKRAANTSDEPSSRFGLIDSLIKEIGDPVQIRNLVMDLFIAGQNMSGTMAAWVFAQLEAHPDIFQRVRDEVLEKFGTEQEPLSPITWDGLRSCTTMQHVILETLRMYPLLANIGRNAKCNTVLPRGGGKDGMQPIAVPKGAAVTCNIYLVHRREAEWGPDAWEFRPDRWVDKKLGPEYAPFGAGPRVCIGQQMTMSEISYLLARMMQRFSEIKAPEGQDNLTKGYRVVIAPKNGVKVRLRRAA
ncbi:cytochrome P450 [Lecanosticta acicola]|uniref:Cytochrome P450 n=1 Tax=Lecanosticta acicola TaxID=111012 RepID=A0AAI8YRI1_9PEZI|nr:cytochrome P450 [Lecanosticta acicola]